MRLAAERRAVAAACRRLAAEGLVLGTAGNVSAPDGELVAITPTGAVLAELEPERGRRRRSRRRRSSTAPLAPTSELDLHLGVYARYGAGAVVHTHAPMATALSCVLDELPCVHYSMLLLGGTVRVAPYATFGTPELAESVVDALDGRTAALMANHGAVTYAEDLDGRGRADGAARVGVHGLLARAGGRRAARARRGRSARRWSSAAIERGYGDDASRVEDEA